MYGQTRANAAEAMFEERAAKNGWSFTKRGWPDYLCELPTGEVIVVEVKPTHIDGKPGRIKESQAIAMQILTDHGIRFFVSDGKTLEPFDAKYHRRRGYERDRVLENPRERRRDPEPFTFVG